ncbi:MAG: FlgK family flagellar hook-associated protein [Clostridia bacterium]
MGNLLGLIQNTLAADEAALATASQNTTGASDPTYHAEEAVIATAPAGIDPIGTSTPPPPNGMEVVTIQRATDPTAAAGLLSAMGTAALASTAVQALQPLQSAFSAGASGGVQTTLQQLETAWSAYQDAPTSAAAAQAVYGAAQQVAQAVDSLEGQLSQVASSLIQQAGQEATQFGSLVQQLGTTQQALATLPPNTESANSLLNQVDALTQQLAQIGGAVSLPTETNQRLIAAPGDGPIWVDGSQVPLGSSTGTLLTMSVNTTGPWYSASVTFTAGTTVAFSPAYGALAGTLQALGTVESWGAQMAGLSNQLASTVPGYPSAALFVSTAAGGLLVNPSLSPTGLQSSVAAQAQTAVNAALGQWGTLAAGVGTVTEQINQAATASESSVTGYQQALQRVVGVDPNQAAVQVLEDQQAFQATAQLLNIQQQLVDSLLQAIA